MRLFRFASPLIFIYILKMIWFTVLVLGILYLSQYESQKFIYWDRHEQQKPNNQHNLFKNGL